MILTGTYILIIGVIIFILLSYVTYNLYQKLKKMEILLAGYLDYLDKISRIIEVSDQKLKEVDHRGSFESDDEVGFFFKFIKDLQELLNDFNLRKI